MTLNISAVLTLQLILISVLVRCNTQSTSPSNPETNNRLSFLHTQKCNPFTGLFHWCKSNRIHKQPITLKENYSSSLYCILLLVISGVETNPGPRPPKYPCGTCSKACKWGEKALACDECNTWYHAACTGINSQEYSHLANSSVSWFCNVCNAPNHSTILYDLIDSAESNTFSVLTNTVSSKSSTSDLDDSSQNLSFGNPIATSSPKRTQQPDRSHGMRTNNKKSLRILIINFQSVKNKRTELPVLTESAKPDIIIGTETWLSEKISNREIFPPELGYDIIRRDRTGDAHGGVLIAARTELGLTQINVSKKAETITGSIKVGNKAFIISSYYRPPNQQDSKFISETIAEFHALRNKHKRSTFLLGGDFNLPDVNWKNNNINGRQVPQAINSAFLQMAADLSLQQINENPTRGENILDLLFTSHPGNIQRCKTLPPIGNSDHDIILIDINSIVHRPKPPRRTIHLWKRANLDGIKAHLSGNLEIFNNSDFLSSSEMWTFIKKTIADAIDKNVPTKRTASRQNHPWMNTELRRLSRRKQRAYAKAKRTKRQKDQNRYKKLKAELQRQSRRAHTEFMKEIVSKELKDNPKRFWSYIKSRKQDASGITALKNKDGFLHSDTPTKAEILNNQFHSVYTKEDLNNIPHKGQSPHQTMPAIHISLQGVKKLLKGLRPYKATGPDEIPAFILKNSAEEIAPYLVRLFQLSLDQGVIPDDWRTANIVPVYKKGEKHTAANYRPISLTSIVCKLLEHIIHSSVMDHFDRHQILCDEQHGFRAKRSCESQLLITLHDIAKNMEEGEQTDVILLDFAKAFDKVPHTRLLHKLEHYGVRNSTLKWIKDFLSNRTQSVILENHKSAPLEVVSGVPQGTVLGPLLFLAYINDLPEATSSSARLFADDCLLYRRIRKTEDADILQKDLTSLEQWEKTWQMSFHPEKCTVIRISGRRQKHQSSYQLHGHNLDVVDSGKYLGVTISNDLYWTKHINQTSSKASRTLGFIRRNLGRCTPEVKENAYLSLVRPSLEYASTVWDPYQNTLIKELEQVQRRAARFVFNNYQDTSPGCVTSLLDKLQWEPLEQRRKKQNMVMCYKIQHNLIDIDPGKYYSAGDNRTRGSHKLRQNTAKRDTFSHSFFPRSTREWNRLPNTVAESESLEDFRARLNTIPWTQLCHLN